MLPAMHHIPQKLHYNYLRDRADTSLWPVGRESQIDRQPLLRDEVGRIRRAHPPRVIGLPIEQHMFVIIGALYTVDSAG